MTTLRIGAPTAARPAPPKSPPFTGPPSHIPDPGADEGGPTYGKMTIKAQGSDVRLKVPYAPREATFWNIGSAWAEIPRDGGRAPLLVRQNKSLPHMSFQLFLGYRNWERPVTDTLDKLKKLAQSDKPLVITYGSWEAGLWRVNGITVTAAMRTPKGEISRCTVDIEFIRASDAKLKLGPIHGGKDDNDKNKDGDKGGAQAKPVRYMVREGDTLQSIGMKFYHNHKAWKKIAKVNKIKNPNKKLKPGTWIRLP